MACCSRSRSTPTTMPAAFCQYVPAAVDQRLVARPHAALRARRAPRTASPSSSSSRRSSTCAREGDVGLALNFATFRAVLASEAGDRLVHRVEKWFLERMSDSMQIESLWTFNEKFQPEWHPRYACYDSPEHLLGGVDRGRPRRVVLRASGDRPLLRTPRRRDPRAASATAGRAGRSGGAGVERRRNVGVAPAGELRCVTGSARSSSISNANSST